MNEALEKKYTALQDDLQAMGLGPSDHVVNVAEAAEHAGLEHHRAHEPRPAMPRDKHWFCCSVPPPISAPGRKKHLLA